MTTVKVWLLLMIFDGSYNHSQPMQFGPFDNQNQCLEIATKIQLSDADVAYSRCDQVTRYISTNGLQP